MANKQMKTLQFPNNPDVYEVVDEKARTEKQNKLVAGKGITINPDTNEISASGIEIPIDDTLSESSSNPVQNQAITKALNKKIEAIPDEYITETELNDKHYLVAQDIAGKADSSVVEQQLTLKANKTDLDSKADKATTLAGYGITDAYTKSEVDDKVSAIYKYKGTKPNYDSLPSVGNKIGDVWNVEDTDKNYAWDGKKWDDLGGIQSVNLDDYYNQTQVNNLVNPKADKSYVDGQLALKDTIVSVDGKLAAKANTTYVNEELAKKQNTLSEEQLTNISNVPNKADTTTVNDQLALKQNELKYAESLPETANEGDIYLVPGAGGGGSSGGGQTTKCIEFDKNIPSGGSVKIPMDTSKIISISVATKYGTEGVQNDVSYHDDIVSDRHTNATWPKEILPSSWGRKIISDSSYIGVSFTENYSNIEGHNVPGSRNYIKITKDSIELFGDGNSAIKVYLFLNVLE